MIVALLLVIAVCQVIRLTMAYRQDRKTAGMLRQFEGAMGRVAQSLSGPLPVGDDPTQIPIGLGLGGDGMDGVVLGDEYAYRAGCRCARCKARAQAHQQ